MAREPNLDGSGGNENVVSAKSLQKRTFRGFAKQATRGVACVYQKDCPLGSAVEHSLHTRGVSSSNLLAGTKFFKGSDLSE